MKYIRTKDDVYEVYTEDLNQENEIDLSIAGFRIKYCKGLYKLVSKEDIVKQANTIEELCDGLIVEQKDSTPNWFIMDINEFIDLDKEEKLYRLKDWNFNAFIKTDKGLIYVAKMNDKGELKLL